MEKIPYLIFQQHDSFYGVEALAVQEIFLLPELTPIAESPDDIVGAINVRGEFLSVMDLNLRFGYQSDDYMITDSVIIISAEDSQIGIIVNEVQEVLMIEENAIKSKLSYRRELPTKSHHFIRGILQIDDGLVMVLDPKNLIQYSQEEEEEDLRKSSRLARQEKPQSFSDLEDVVDVLEEKVARPKKFLEHPVFCPNATPEAKIIFRERATNLRRQEENQDFIRSKIPLAVIALNGEFLGLNLDLVREFTDVRKVTAIPCTPPHIVGNMNLRGEILTLVDIRNALNMQMGNMESLGKAIVVEVSDIVAGIVVDEVLDVMYLNPLDITPVPTAIHYTNDEYLRGTAPYRDKMMSILDLQKMMAKGALIVDEEV
jgi:purine-binding chemotaxis protein CheW